MFEVLAILESFSRLQRANAWKKLLPKIRATQRRPDDLIKKVEKHSDPF